MQIRNPVDFLGFVALTQIHGIGSKHKGKRQERPPHLFQTHKNRPFQIFGNSA